MLAEAQGIGNRGLSKRPGLVKVELQEAPARFQAAPTSAELRTAADMTTRCAFKIEDPSGGPGRVDFTAPDEGLGLEGPRNLRSRGTHPPPK